MSSKLPVSAQVFWLFGLSGAGKSTLAASLAAFLRSKGQPVLALDGDVLRAGLCRGLGFSDADRTENLRRAAETARIGADSGLCVVAAFITPLDIHRELVRQIVGGHRLSLVHVDAPLEVCRQRDVKGLYARAGQGKLREMTGITSAFEPPAAPDLSLPTADNTPTTSARVLAEFAWHRLEPAR